MMKNLLPPLLLAIVALGGGWWLGAESLTHTAAPASTDPAILAAPVGDTLPAAGLARRAALLKKLEHPRAADIQRLMESGEVHGSAVYDLARLWARQDPAGMWRWFSEDGNKRLSAADVGNVIFPEWFRADPDAAVAAFRGAKYYDFRSSAARGLLSHLLGADDALRQKLLPLLDELTATGAGLDQGLGKEPEYATKLLSLPASAARDTLLAQTAHAWLQRDWKGATAWAATLTEPVKSKIMAEFVSTALNPNVPFSFYPDNEAGSTKDAACLTWAREWFTTEAPGELRRKLGPDYMRALADTDAGAALAWAQENLSARPLANAVIEILQHQADPAKARAVVEQLPPGGVKQRAAFAAAGFPGAESVQWLMGQVKPDAWDWGQVGAQWAFADAAAFRNFIAAQDSAALPKALVAAGIGNLVRKDAPGTLTWATAFPQTGWASDALRGWSREDPAASATWLKGHPDTSIKPETVKALAGDYFRRAPRDAVAWATALSPGPAREASVTALRQALASTSTIKPDEKTALEAKLAVP